MMARGGDPSAGQRLECFVDELNEEESKPAPFVKPKPKECGTSLVSAMFVCSTRRSRFSKNHRHDTKLVQCSRKRPVCLPVQSYLPGFDSSKITTAG